MAAGGVMVGRGYVSIRPEFEGDWSRAVNVQASRSGASGGAAFTKAFSLGLKGLTKGVIPALGTSVVAALAPAAGAAGLLAPTILAAASASVALQVGLSGVSDAMSEAFNPTSPEKLAEAMAKLSPNAQAFVKEVRSAKPALDALRLSVQDRLFREMDSTFATAAKTTLPIFQNSLTNSAGALNLMGRQVLNTATGLGKSGALGTALSGANEGLYNMAGVPATIVQGLVQIGAAAGPAFGRLTASAGGAFESLSTRMTTAFESGSMQQFIETGVTVLQGLGSILSDAFATLGNVMGAAADAGTQVLAVVGELFAELRRVTALPEVQAALQSIFLAVSQIAQAIAPVIGAALQALLPLVAAVAPVIGQLAQTLGPVLTSVVQALGAALTPIVTALMPVVQLLGDAIIRMVSALVPLLEPIGQVIGLMIQALVPVLAPVVEILTQLVEALAGPLTAAVQAFIPWFEMLGGLFTQVFGAIEPLIAPVINVVTILADILVQVLSAAIGTLMAAIEPLIPVFTELITSVLNALLPILPTLGEAFAGISEAVLTLVEPLAGIVSQLAQQLAPIITSLTPILADLAGMLAGALAAALPPLIDALLILVQAFMPLFPLLGEILGMVVQLGADLLMQLLPPFMELIQAGVDLVVALLPILPPLAEIIGLVADLAVNVLSWLLPPLASLVSLLVGAFAGALGTAIGWLAGLVDILAKVVTWVMEKAGPAITWLWENVVRPTFQWIGDKAKWLWENAIKPAWDKIKVAMQIVGAAISILWNEYASPILTWIGDKGKWLWDKALKPAFDNIKKGVEKIGQSFEDAKDFIAKAWNKVQDIAKKPVKFIIETIYNKGIVPTWNKIATAFGADPLKTIALPKGFARGGVLPGMSSWRQGDDQLVPMRRGEGVYVSEAMRDPYERARLFAVNKAAMQGKSLSAFQPGFAKGGIFDWIGSTASKGLDLAKEGVSWLKDGLKESAIAGMNEIVRPLIDKISGSASLYRDMISGIPKRMLKVIFGYSGEADKKLAESGIGGKGYKAGLAWARTQHGKPYQWGGNGNPSWDCSGFLSAIESVIRGQKPHRRWATGAFSGRTAPAGWVLNHRSPFTIGITNAGVGHTAGTLNGVNVESRGGDGVIVGPRARGSQSMLFTDIYGLKYDAGGWLQPGVTATVNATGQPEAILTANQWRSITAAAAQPSGLQPGDGLTLVVDGQEFHGYVDTRAGGVVSRRDQQLLSTIRAGRKS